MRVLRKLLLWLNQWISRIMLKIASWNVNSIRVRLPQLLDWLNVQQPDILAVQETKVPDRAFPIAEIQAVGYHTLFSGQKSYNGVALLSRQVGTEVITDLPTFKDAQRRLLGATYGKIRILNIYAPNGSLLGSEKYQYKLAWFAHLCTLLRTALEQYTQLVVLGDFNVAPEDCDVHDPIKWAGDVLVSEPERCALQNLMALGLWDAFRLFTQPEKSFSWWDYRGGAFRRKHGVRIDLILVNQALSARCTSCQIDELPRRLERPSDHAPVMAIFDR